MQTGVAGSVQLVLDDEVLHSQPFNWLETGIGNHCTWCITHEQSTQKGPVSIHCTCFATNAKGPASIQYTCFACLPLHLQIPWVHVPLQLGPSQSYPS